MKRRNFLQIIPVVAVAPQLLQKLANKPIIVSLQHTPMTPRMVHIRAVVIRWKDGSQSFYDVVDAPLNVMTRTIDDLNKAEFGIITG